MRYYIVGTVNRIPTVNNVVRGVEIGDGKAAITTNTEIPGGSEITEGEYCAYDPGVQSNFPPEIGPILMDITLKQAELEMKLDAIGTMLVPTLPEV